MATIRNKQLAMFGFVAALGLLVAAFLAYLIVAKPAYADYKEKLAKQEHVDLGPQVLDASWVISGSPKFRVNIFGQSSDKSAISGIWECTGPAQFEWHYGVDESIYILEGTVDIEYLGKKFTLRAGDSTHFAAGTKAKWTVSDRVKKTFAIYQVGRFTRLMRRIFNPATAS
jgi:uncharacterized cupin superfamily protein